MYGKPIHPKRFQYEITSIHVPPVHTEFTEGLIQEEHTAKHTEPRFGVLRNDATFVYKLRVSIDDWEGTYKDSKMVQNGNFVRYELINNIRMLCWMRKI